MRRNTRLKWSYKKMIKILFICHGNICRSPMAEFVMKD
ncbi:MAG: low molecular weight phosphotyrosine protein phosphatase, partial [Gemmiger sp.]